MVEELRRVKFRKTEWSDNSIENDESTFFRRRRVKPLLESDDCDVVRSVAVGKVVVGDDALNGKLLTTVRHNVADDDSITKKNFPKICLPNNVLSF